MYIKDEILMGMSGFQKFLGGRSIKAFPEILDPDEKVVQIALGSTYTNYFLIAVTDKRIIHFRKSLSGKNNTTSFYYSELKSFSIVEDLLRNKVAIATINGVNTFRVENLKAIPDLVINVQSMMRKSTEPFVQANSSPQQKGVQVIESSTKEAPSQKNNTIENSNKKSFELNLIFEDEKNEVGKVIASEVARIARKTMREEYIQSYDGYTNAEIKEGFMTSVSEFEGVSLFDSIVLKKGGENFKVYIVENANNLVHIGSTPLDEFVELEKLLKDHVIISNHTTFSGGKTKEVELDWETDKEKVIIEKYDLEVDISFTFEAMTDKNRHIANIFLQNESASSKITSRSKKNQYIKARKLVNDYVVIDFETTGLRPAEEEIIQIGAVKYVNHEKVGEFCTLIKPTKNISKRITEITSITNKMLEAAPPIADEIDNLLSFIGENTLIAYNASFDMGFLYALNDKGFNIPRYRVLDTLPLARKVITDSENHKLVTLSKYLGIEHKAHDALGDCLATAKVYQHCYNKQKKQNLV